MAECNDNIYVHLLSDESEDTDGYHYQPTHLCPQVNHLAE